MNKGILKCMFTALLAVITLTVSAQGDLSVFQLKGKVSSCSWNKRYSTETYKFNSAGKWTGMNGNTLAAASVTVKRNSMGKILSYSYIVDELFPNTYIYKYDSAGKVLSVTLEEPEGGYTETYTYDKNGMITKGVCKSSYIEELGSDNYIEKTITYVYTYLATDAKGNWTKRKVTGSDKESWTETRTIKYFN